MAQSLRYADEPDPTAEKLIDEGYRIREDYNDILDRKDGVRTALRALAKSGVLDEDQYAQMEELFPPRGKGESKDEKEES